MGAVRAGQPAPGLLKPTPGRSALSQTAARGALFACLLLPWLNPWVPGPSLYIGPWLVAAFCGVFILLLRQHLSVQLVLASWWVAAAASALIGLVQYAGLAHWAWPWINQVGPGEAFGNLRQRNQLATLTSIGLIALLAWVDQRQTLRFPRWAWGVVALLAAGNAASSSRTGLLTWALVLVMLAWWQRGRASQVVALALKAVLAYLAVVLLLSWVLRSDGGLFLRLAQSGSDSRRELWANVLTLIAQKPWTGWGWGELSYAHFITLFPGPRFPMLLGNAHNLPLHLAVELGIPAALLICGAVGWAIWRGRPWAEVHKSRQTAWAVLAVMGLHSLLEFPLWMGPFQITAVLCVGYLWITRPAAPPAPFSIKTTARLMNGAALGLLAMLMAASLDYHAVSQRYAPADQRSSWWTGANGQPLGGWLFNRQAQFATLATTPVTAGNAAALHALALDLVHYSPEPLVIEKLIQSASLLGQDADVRFYAERYQRAFPAEHSAWKAAQGSGNAAKP